MEGNHLGTKEILAGGDALGNADSVATLAVDDLLGTPDAVVEAVFLNLEPAAADTGIRGGIADLLQVSNGRTLVAAIHDVVGGAAGGGKHVAPDSSDILAGLNGDDLGGGRSRVGVAVASHGVGGDILDRAVVRRNTNTVANALVNTADLEGAEDGVSAGGARQDDRSEYFHGECWLRSLEDSEMCSKVLDGC